MSVATVLAKVRNILSDEPWSDTINAAYTAPATTFTITDFAELVRGDTLDFQDDGTYDLFIVDATPSSSTVTVGIGYDGATNASHSNGARYYKSPRWPSKNIVDAMAHVVDTWLWPELWVLATTTYTPSPSTTNLYDLPSGFLTFLNDRQYLSQPSAGSIEDILYSFGTVVQVPSSVSATGWALRVTKWQRIDTDATLYYRTKVTTTNMTAAMEPVIAYGTAAYLLRAESIEKTDRFDEDDRSGRMLRTARSAEEQFEFEKQKIAKTLSDTYGKPPVRFLKRPYG